MSALDFSAVLARAEQLYDRSDVEQVIASMAQQIESELGDDDVLFVPLMNGGMIFASLLALALPMNVTFDSIQASRFHGDTTGDHELQWRLKPKHDLAGRTVLLVDDILDEGHTLKAVHAYCQEQGAAKVRAAVLTEKKHDRCVAGVAADFVGLMVPDRYVFGFGMDYREHGRNLPGIYAAHPEDA